MNEVIIECNDPLKEVKQIFAEIKLKHSIMVDGRIKDYYLQQNHLKNPQLKEYILRNLHQRFGLAIADNKLAKIEEYKNDDLMLYVSAAVMDLDQVYNYIVEAYDKGLKTGFENGQLFSKHLRKEQPMIVQNEPKVCKEPGCGMKFYYISNEETGKYIPVDLESLSANEIQNLELFNKVYFDKTRHVSHFKTCKNPNRFSKSKKSKFGKEKK